MLVWCLAGYVSIIGVGAFGQTPLPWIIEYKLMEWWPWIVEYNQSDTTQLYGLHLLIIRCKFTFNWTPIIIVKTIRQNGLFIILEVFIVHF